MELLCTGGWKLSANGLRDWGGVGKAGYGKDGKLSCAFHFPTTPAAAGYPLAELSLELSTVRLGANRLSEA
jgi:hypothetical protein